MNVMEDLYTCAQAGAMLGKSEVTVRQIASRYFDIGTKFGKSWMFTEDDIARMRLIGADRSYAPKRITVNGKELFLAPTVGERSISTIGAAKHLGIDEDTIKKMASEHKIGSHAGKRRLFSAHDIELLESLRKGVA